MIERHPDIEIYIKRVPLEDLTQWLERRFEVSDRKDIGETLKLSMTFEGAPLTCTVFENAAKGGYTSISFEPNNTPWDDDEACANEAYELFQLEVRCITGGWTTNAPVEGGWYRFTKDGRSVVNWLT
ncbi:MAG: hypothetical protein JJ921_11175 [Pseudomonadales bacterium]|nr:hypothetical protein [Pseudomonadales bacterium]MBO7005317.1 hypothetical protein [Pseudomonadales bacterium]